MAHLPIEALAVFPPPGMAAPNSFTFTLDNSHLLYLSASPENPVQQLYTMNVQTGEIRVAVTPPGGGTQEDKLSPEEELRRQRERMLAVGITHYSRAAESDRLLIPIMGNIYVQDNLDAPLRLVVDCTGHPPALTPVFSPDGSKIAYVQDDELYVVSADGGEPVQITHGARGTGKTNGLAEYIAQEELARSMGFWWSPDGSRVVYAEVDETHIPVYRIMHQGKDEVGDVAQEDHRYPFAGAENAKVRLAAIPVGRDDDEPVWLDLNTGEENYVARVFWWKDGAPGAELLNRAQNIHDLVRFDPETGERTTIVHETSDYWVSMRQNHFKLLSDNHFVWSSERSGFNHLYLYDANGNLLQQLTDGEWVVDAVEGVDEENGFVYFTGAKDTPLEKHLYRVSLNGSDIIRLTAEAGTHSVKLDNDCKRFVDLYHSVTTPPTVILKSLQEGTVEQVIHTPNDPRLDQFQLEPPEFVTLQNRDGTTLYGAIYRPPSEFGQGPFPTIVHVYGGPGPQMVANSWTMTSALQLQYLRRQGFLIFRLDNRGSARRGIQFEGALKHRMGTVEVDDQVDGVRWLVEQGLADPERVGATGWSYGGYMSLMSLLKAPQVFKVAVAGAPVTHWDGYDTAYTERYMGTPEENPEGYHDGSVIAHIDNLRGKLLLVHGLLDENVHFRHTARLMNALNRARKRYDLLLFPDERHMPRRQDDRTYLHERIVEYFQQHL
jgi:dipeptidyl-peptidase 4